MEFRCKKCGTTYPSYTLNYRCECGGLFAITNPKNIEKENILGEGNTPLLKKIIQGKELYIKVDYLQPTGSFKDRGAALMLDFLSRQGIDSIVEDSSGNAGAAIAAYAAAANINCQIYLPASTSEGKIKQIKAYGADIIKVTGGREATSREVLKAAENTYYASHVYNPLFFMGVSSLAFELAVKLKDLESIFVPVGNGTMLLGLYYGFRSLGIMPRLIGVQSNNCAPIYNSMYNEKKKIHSTTAEGIAVENPARRDEIIEAIKCSKGKIMTVSEEEIIEAKKLIQNEGLYIEMTAAVAPAAFLKSLERGDIATEGKVLVPLTGSGLKK